MKFAFTNLPNQKEREIKEMFSRFDKYFIKEPICRTSMSVLNSNDVIRVETTISSPRLTARAVSEGKNFLELIDKNYEKIKKQIRRSKDKKLSSRRVSIREAEKPEEIPQEEYSEFECA